MDAAIWNRFAIPMWSDVSREDEYFARQPLLAHYTSIANVEKILQSNELWFANPLYMNDAEEIRFGIHQGLDVIARSNEIAKACGSSERFSAFLNAFDNCYQEFAYKHAADTYVFCMSEHAPTDNDGLLSMWRGYGGNGSGVAIVFDAGKVEEPEDSALVLASVHYETGQARVSWLRNKALELSELLLKEPIQAEHLRVAAKVLFERFKMFALFTKHYGFREEREWRIVYTPSLDQNGVLTKHLGYSVGARGIEPRLKFQIAPTPGVTAGELSLEKVIDRIILGPTTSSPLAVAAFHRLLDATGHATLKERVIASGIPFRHHP